MLNTSSRHQAGISLVELLVGLAVSLVVLGGISTVYLNSSRGARLMSAANQLNQDMRSVMDIMVNDIRRAGHWASATSGANPFTAATAIPQIAAAGNCILYSYDATFAGGTAGSVDSNVSYMDFFGFRLANGAVQTLLPTANLSSTATATTCATDNLWENLTDPRAVTVTALTLDTVGSQCIAFIPSTYSAANTTTFTAWTATAGAIGPACDATTLGSPGLVSGTFPANSNTFVETRQINITLSALSVVDSTLTGSLTETALVRNNRVIAP